MPVRKCNICPMEFDPTKDFFITVNERKGPSVDVCSPACMTEYLDS